jgi:hypothetical protein
MDRFVMVGEYKTPAGVVRADTELSPQHRIPLIKFGRLGLSSMTGRHEADTSDWLFYHYKRCVKKTLARQDESPTVVLQQPQFE